MARLTKIGIENFKGIGEYTEFDLKPITLLFGANSAGKSTILHALHYAREVFEYRNYSPSQTVSGGEFIDLGGFLQCIHKQNPKHPITFSFELVLQQNEIPYFHHKLSDFLESSPVDDNGINNQINNIETVLIRATVSWDKNNYKPFVSHYSLDVNDEPLGEITCHDIGSSSKINRINPNHPLLCNSAHSPKVTQGVGQLVFDYLYQKRAQQNVAKMDDSWFKKAMTFLKESIPDGTSTQWGIKDFEDALPVWEKYLTLSNTLSEQGKLNRLWVNHANYQYKNLSPTQKHAFADYESNLACRIQLELVLSRLFIGTGQLVKNELAKFKYLGPIRKIPERNQVLPHVFDTNGMANGLAAWAKLHNSGNTFIQEVNRWLGDSQCLGTGYHIVVKEYIEAELESMSDVLQGIGMLDDFGDPTGLIHGSPIKTSIRIVSDDIAYVELQPQDVGVGISQVIPVLVMALDPDNQIIGVEQPELHLHPKMQSELGDLFVAAALQKDSQFLLETHSEHLLLRVLRRIREQHEGVADKDAPKINPEDVSVLYFEKTDDGNRIHNLRIDDRGEFIDQWPEGFFDERDKELF